MVLPLIGVAASLAAEFAPGLIRKLAGDDAADVADKVIGIAKDITGQGDPEKAVEVLRADPEAVLVFKQRAAELEIEIEKAYLADRQDARNRDVALRKAGYHNYRADVMLALAFVCLIIIIVATWMGRLDMPDQVFALLNMAAGMILGMIKDAFQFEFGSSRGSKEKDLARQK